MDSKKLSATIAGHLCLDITPLFARKDAIDDIRQMLAPGKLVNMDGVSVSTGGVVSNTGVSMAVLGIDVLSVAKVGDDSFGKAILDVLEPHGAHRGIKIVPGKQTSYSVVLTLPGMDRIFLHDPGLNHSFCSDDLDYNRVAQTRWFHYGYPTLMRSMYQNKGVELVKMFKKVKETGVPTSLDMTPPDPSGEAGKLDWVQILTDTLPFVDIFMPSVEEALYMLDRPTFDTLNSQSQSGDLLENLNVETVRLLGQRILDLGSKAALIKCGKLGMYLRTSDARTMSSLPDELFGSAQERETGWTNRELFEETFTVSDFASATGAGDAAIAGFLASILYGKNAADSLKIACAVGAQNCTDFTAFGGIKPYSFTEKFIRDQTTQKNTLALDTQCWRYDSANRTWLGRLDKNFNI